MTHTLPLSEVKIKLSRLVDGIIRREDQIIITRNGKPAAVLLSAEEYESWTETQEIKQNPELMEEIRQGLRQIQRARRGHKRYSLEELFESSLE